MEPEVSEPQQFWNGESLFLAPPTLRTTTGTGLQGEGGAVMGRRLLPCDKPQLTT
jgi:hypothetical protein